MICELEVYSEEKGWAKIEKTGKPIQFESEYEVSEWIEDNKALFPDCHTYFCRRYIVCRVCGEEVDLVGFTNTCYACGTEYNNVGCMLAPREQWEEEY